MDVQSQDIVMIVTVLAGAIISAHNLPRNLEHFSVRFVWNLYSAVLIAMIASIQNFSILDTNNGVVWVWDTLRIHMPLLHYIVCLMIGFIALGMSALVPASAHFDSTFRLLVGVGMACAIEFGALVHVLTVSTANALSTMQ